MLIKKYYPLIKRALFAMDAENAHTLALSSLKILSQRGPYDPIECQPRECMGLTFKNPVGLAAGFDKNANFIHSLSGMGFGFIEVGTVTPRPQKGNPRPRIFRLEKDEAIINRMGFNNDGMLQIADRLKRSCYSGVLGVNIGKNKTTPNEDAVNDYLACMECLAPYADYFVLNVSSPNTPGLRDLQKNDLLEALLSKLKKCQKQLQHAHKKPLPLAIKLAPDTDVGDQIKRLELVKAMGIEGVIMSNTTCSRPKLQSKYREESGGLSGAPLGDLASQMLKVAKDVLGDSTAIIASGGIMSAQDAQKKYALGADLLQVYTGIIYKGPGLVDEILKSIIMSAKDS